LNRQLAKRVRERTAELETLNKELEAFTYSVAHDLKAPLRHITAFADQLKGHAGSKLDAEDRDYLQVISRSARTLSEMVAALLNLSRLGRKPLEKVPVDLTRLVRRVIEELRHDVGHREVAWQIDKLPEVDADPTLMRQVFLNLINNAIEALSSSASNTRVLRVETTTGETGGALVTIADSGPGVEAADMDKMFEAFFTTKPDGMGMGLAISRSIVEAHGGRLWATRGDRGLVFHVLLPLTGR